MRTILATLFLLGVNAVHADMEGQGIEVICDQNLRFFKIAGYDEPLQERHPGSTTYVDYDRHRVRCVIRQTEIEADFQLSPPRDHGLCGVAPGGYVYAIKINGVSILENFGIHGCADSVGGVEVQNVIRRSGKSDDDGYLLKVCGSASKTDSASYNGCVSVNEKQAPQILNLTKGPGYYRDPFSVLLGRLCRERSDTSVTK